MANAPRATSTVAFDWSPRPGQFMFSISVINCTYSLIALRRVAFRRRASLRQSKASAPGKAAEFPLSLIGLQRGHTYPDVCGFT